MFSAKITAVLFAMACPSCDKVYFAAYFTDAGPSMCEATAVSMNRNRKPTDPKFICEYV